ncbi:MAG: hypothetical protein U9Q74_01440 [Gemmatimonadota bacterium]|nr:hypothetical protein [Gemmatimonadota bacterium]
MTGRALVSIPGYACAIVLPCCARDIRPMGALRQRLAGALTPGQTTPGGIFISETLLAIQAPGDIAELFLHESTHWWQCWRRMGVWSYWATYIWQVILSVFRLLARRQSLTGVHADQLMEREARAASLNMREAITELLRIWQPARFDALPWLTAALPPQRR